MVKTKRVSNSARNTLLISREPDPRWVDRLSWTELNDALRDEQDYIFIQNMMDVETRENGGKCRRRFVLRMHNRMNKLRNRAEIARIMEGTPYRLRGK